MKNLNFVRISLELNLFFQRIMKEHMIFMEIGLPVKNSNLILEADKLKRSFEEILQETVAFSNEIISQKAIDSNEIVTPYTLDAETIVENLTGVCIDKDITLSELKLQSNPNFDCSKDLVDYVYDLNNRAINLVAEIINFKEKVLTKVLNCEVFISIYPHMLEHLIREAKYYLKCLLKLQEHKVLDKEILEKKIFWDDIMEEHAEFIRGMLDPTEKELLEKADDFAELFEQLKEDAEKATEENISDIMEKNLKATEEIKDFKVVATEGLIKCEIKSIANPLLADHVSREASHYLRILRAYLEKC